MWSGDRDVDGEYHNMGKAHYACRHRENQEPPIFLLLYQYN